MDTLQKSEEQLRVLLDANPDAVILKDGEGRWVLANDYALQLFCLEGVPYKNKKMKNLQS
ncbi:PAS domain-containing protein [Aneurinibacillus terranovensis]|uniref:PAS domain-containing protein n=1 Tax=Aneurinibacillus terranovensis TaxID=278991 RepID=UPI00040C4EA2|nr:PAS domain-containing protein [Aneurinibacillus terranovensis]